MRRLRLRLRLLHDGLSDLPKPSRVAQAQGNRHRRHVCAHSARPVLEGAVAVSTVRRCEAYRASNTCLVHRQCSLQGHFDHYHQRFLCDIHSNCKELAFSPLEALEIIRGRNKMWMREWRARRSEAT